jgi:ABC-type oligopeptide transport system ATPase subunit
MQFDDLLPGDTDRAAFVGQTGSGKTTLARHVLERRHYVVVYDPKGMIRWPGWQVLKRLKDACNSPSARMIYQPSYEELANADAVDAFFAWIYRREHTTVYVDEVYAIARGDVYPYHYGACLTRGREKDIAVYTATQRPARVPQIMFSEAEHVYCFRLKMPQDRQRVEEMTGIDRRLVGDLPKQQFYYAPQDGDVSGPYRLDLSTRSAPTVPSTHSHHQLARI